LDTTTALAKDVDQSVDRVGSLFAEAGNERDILRAWEGFLSGVTPVGPSVRVVVESSWKRSLMRGVDARADRSPLVLGEGSFQTLLKRNRLLSWAASATMHQNAALLRGTRSIVILTDPGGVILDVVGDPSTADLGQRINLSRGGSWNESDVGTNGIGMAIATDQAVQVHASEHFCEGVKKWTCAAAPIHDPRDASLLGVLDISGPDVSFCQHNLALVLSAAHQIEAVILERLLAKRTRLFEACLSTSRQSDGGMVLLDHNGFVVCVNDEASERIERGEISAALSVGKRLIEPGKDLDVDALRKNLPPECQAEWLHPVVEKQDTLGAVILIPRQGEHYLPSKAARVGSMSSERVSVSESSEKVDKFSRIVGSSPAIEKAVARARKLASSQAPILIEGETGVGKELFASAIQAESTLAEGPFVICNCGAVSEELIGSELFGYVKGAFTGASTDGRVGRFEQASGGTLCLDEVGEMPLGMQPYLLRVLDEGFVYRIGENKPRKVDVRLLAMTNRDLREEVLAGRFRRDLYYRIGVTTIAIPSLRERGADVDELIRHFLRDLSTLHHLEVPSLSREVFDALRCYPWPGNVRELRNVIESLLLTKSNTAVTLDDLPRELFEQNTTTSVAAENMPVRGLEATERQAIEKAIEDNRGNLTRAAKQLGISRSTMYRKIEHYQLLVK